MIASSVLDYAWLKEVDIAELPLIIIAEGLLMYFEEDQVRKLMNKLVDAFSGAEMLLEMMTPTIAKLSKRHDTVSKTQASFKWGIKHGREMEDFNAAIRFVDDWNYFDFHRERWRMMGRLALLPAFKNRFNNGIVHLRFQGN